MIVPLETVRACGVVTKTPLQHTHTFIQHDCLWHTVTFVHIHTRSHYALLSIKHTHKFTSTQYTTPIPFASIPHTHNDS